MGEAAILRTKRTQREDVVEEFMRGGRRSGPARTFSTWQAGQDLGSSAAPAVAQCRVIDSRRTSSHILTHPRGRGSLCIGLQRMVDAGRFHSMITIRSRPACSGVMFTPQRNVVAADLRRRDQDPGGRVAWSKWTPTALSGRCASRHSAPPPPPARWFPSPMGGGRKSPWRGRSRMEPALPLLRLTRRHGHVATRFPALGNG